MDLLTFYDPALEPATNYILTVSCRCEFLQRTYPLIGGIVDKSYVH